MIIETGTRAEFKRYVLINVQMMTCQGGHTMIIDPEWLRGGIRPQWICGHCHIEFGRIYQHETEMKKPVNSDRLVDNLKVA